MRSEPKVVVIGIDGLPHSLINSFINSGIMPKLAQIIPTGSFFRMKSSLPEISSVAWTGFMTGCNPGKHGIFGFMELDDSYGFRFPNFSDIKAPTFWEKLDLSSVVINIPETYPAIRPLKGILISGFVALDLKNAVYPKHLYPELKKMGYRLDVRAELAVKNKDAFFEDLFTVFEKRCDVIRHLFNRNEWQLFIGTITETDRLHHYFYHEVLNDGPYHDRIIDFYCRLDSFVGEMFERAMEKKALFITCSDHGFCPIDQEVYLNRWLMENNFLVLSNGQPGLKGISESSSAFCLDPGRVYIHTKKRYPKGCIDAIEYNSVKEELADRLASLTFNGKPVIQKVYLGENIFNGPYSENGPDLYLLSYPGFDLKGAVGRPEVFGTTHFTGMHTMDDAHLFISANYRLEDPQIEIIADLIESYFSSFEKMI